MTHTPSVFTTVEVRPGPHLVARFGEVVAVIEPGASDVGEVLAVLRQVAGGELAEHELGMALADALNRDPAATESMVVAVPGPAGRLRVVCHGWGAVDAGDAGTIPYGWVDRELEAASSVVLGRADAGLARSHSGQPLHLVEGVVLGGGVVATVNLPAPAPPTPATGPTPPPRYRARPQATAPAGTTAGGSEPAEKPTPVASPAVTAPAGDGGPADTSAPPAAHPDAVTAGDRGSAAKPAPVAASPSAAPAYAGPGAAWPGRPAGAVPPSDGPPASAVSSEPPVDGPPPRTSPPPLAVPGHDARETVEGETSSLGQAPAAAGDDGATLPWTGSQPAPPRPSVPWDARARARARDRFLAAPIFTHLQAAPPQPLPIATKQQSTEVEAPGPQSVLIDGVECVNGHFNTPYALYCGVCGISLAQQTMVTVLGPRPSLGTMVMDDGTAYALDADYVIGRNPSASTEVAKGVARPLMISDDSNALSQVHAAIRLVDWDVTVVDLNSSNGTHVVSPEGGGWQRLPADAPQILQPGARVAIGQRWFVFESHLRSRDDAR